jgi:hypothetical protein
MKRTFIYQTKDLGQYVSMFEEHMTHELAHYFYGLAPEVPDATHDLVAKHGYGFWLPHFLGNMSRQNPTRRRRRPNGSRSCNPIGFAFDIRAHED